MAFPKGAFVLLGILSGAGLFSLQIVSVFALAVTLAANLAVSKFFTFTLTLSFTIALVLAVNLAKVIGNLPGSSFGAFVETSVTVLTSTYIAWQAMKRDEKYSTIALVLAVNLAKVIGNLPGSSFGAFVETSVTVLTSTYIAWQAMKRDEKYSWVWNMAIVFAARGGTNFYDVDLTDADFTGANLKNTDFRKATLTRTCFSKATKLDMIRADKTYLQNTKLHPFLTKREGQDKNFDGENLQGVNLQNSILIDASFIGADLSEANLQDADLSRVYLVKTKLDGTDFTGATLTGAYIEDWGITNDTKLNGVRCQYIFMRLPTKENPDPLRKPDNTKEFFADGDFGDFIKPIFDTLDLYHNQDVDPRAIAISFKPDSILRG